jgi:hypothetical protein
LKRARAAARADFEQRFSIARRNELLGGVYRAVAS